MKKLAFVSFLVLSTACSTQTAQRETASRLAGQVSKMQTDLNAMAESRTNIAVARHHVAERLLRSALETELANADRLDNMAADARRKFDDALKKAEQAKKRRAKADEEIAAAEALAKEAKSRVNPHTEELGAAAKLLGRLAEKPNWKEQLNFFFHFFSEVQSSLDEMNDESEQSENEAESQTADQAPAPATTT